MAAPLTIVIFGATGDLTGRKLIPALFQLYHKQHLPKDTRIVGVARTPLTDDEFRERLLHEARLAEPRLAEPLWRAFLNSVEYVAGDAASPGGLHSLTAWLLARERGRPANRLFYLSVAPDLYAPIAANLAHADLNREDGGFRRLIIEKPFGRDLGSALDLNRVLHEHFTESQLYRIDHYLGKETVQNILVFRFANTLFESLWNHNYIDHVQITVAEKDGVGKRAPYYDGNGILRDMFQNHLLQVLTLVAMEPPHRYEAQLLRDAKLQVLQAVRLPAGLDACHSVTTGQYAGYRAEPKVNPQSRTPTFAAIRVEVDNERWRNVPFYLRSGKALAHRYSEVIIQFHCPPRLMFPLQPGELLRCNRLTLRIQPDEKIQVGFQLKVPDTRDGARLFPADLVFDYGDTFGETAIPDAYERLLLDAIAGDAALFMRGDEIEQAWRIMDPLIAATENAAAAPEQYAPGSWGPGCAEKMLAADGRSWQNAEN